MSEPAGRSRTADRDFDMWARYIAGQTQQQIAGHYGLDQSTVSRVIGRMRDDVPVEERRARQRRQLADLDHMRREALDLVDRDPLPAYSNGRPVLLADGVTVAEDHIGRMRAMDLALRVQEREARALGTDAATRVSVEAEQAGERVKALLRRVAEQSDSDGPAGAAAGL